MKEYLVDTNVIIYHLSGEQTATRFIVENLSRIHISFITFIEVLSYNFQTKDEELAVRNFMNCLNCEWEYAARGGSGGIADNFTYAGGNDVGVVAWYSDNSGSSTHSVSGKVANKLGLFDMSGNVYKWCWDWYGNYPGTVQTDYKGAVSGSDRVYRGGSWGTGSEYLQVWYRSYGNPYPDGTSYSISFRVVAKQ